MARPRSSSHLLAVLALAAAAVCLPRAFVAPGKVDRAVAPVAGAATSLLWEPAARAAEYRYEIPERDPDDVQYFPKFWEENFDWEEWSFRPESDYLLIPLLGFVSVVVLNFLLDVFNDVGDQLVEASAQQDSEGRR
mmetsp:Transcript_19764/g.37181  ORF Transcript_19764/g.37181 Transcript_19764/m.37181 type:complete len:136 (-) Transcript_19764:93-500(-)